MATSNNPLVTGYLLLYNAVLTIGWSYLLVLTIQYSSDRAELWARLEVPLKIFQTAALLEVVHALVRIVPSNVFLTFFQVLSRVFLVWGILHLSPPSQISIGFLLVLFAWTVTEIIRYGYYVLHLIGLSVLIQWFRYTLFIVLYPIGVTGELICIYSALQYVNEKGIGSIRLPNAYNFAFDYQYFLIGVLLSYIPIFPQLYLHMFGQRKKILGGNKNKTN